MTLRTNVSVLFLLAVTASVVGMSMADWQEIVIDVIPVEDVHGSGVDSRRDVDDTVWPRPRPHRPAGRRRRRMLTDFDRQAVVNTLNSLRRLLGAPNMYYVVC